MSAQLFTLGMGDKRNDYIPLQSSEIVKKFPGVSAKSQRKHK